MLLDSLAFHFALINNLNMVQHVSFTDPRGCFAHLKIFRFVLGLYPRNKSPWFTSVVAYIICCTNHRPLLFK